MVEDLGLGRSDIVMPTRSGGASAGGDIERCGRSKAWGFRYDFLCFKQPAAMPR